MKTITSIYSNSFILLLFKSVSSTARVRSVTGANQAGASWRLRADWPEAFADLKVPPGLDRVKI